MKLEYLKSQLAKREIVFPNIYNETIKFSYKDFPCIILLDKEDVSAISYGWPNDCSSLSYVKNLKQLFDRINESAPRYEAEQNGSFYCDCSGETKIIDETHVLHNCKSLFCQKQFGDVFITYRRAENKKSWLVEYQN